MREVPPAGGRAYAVLRPTGMNMARMGEWDGIEVFVGFVCLLGLGEKDSMELMESTLHSFGSKM